MTRVMVIGPTDADSFADNVGDTLTRTGHDVRMAGPARRPVFGRRLKNALEIARERLPEIDRRFQAHLIENERDFRPDVIITVDRRVQPAIVGELRANGAKMALWFPDHVANLGRHDLFLAPYDRFLFKNPQMVEQLVNVHGIPASYVPEAANSSWHRSSESYGSEQVIVVAGNIHPTRAIFLDRLISSGIPISIYGPPPPSWISYRTIDDAHTGRYVTKRQKADVFRRARAVINNLHPAEQSGMNCRLFEAAASGAVVLTEARSGLESMFDVGTEVLTFDSFNTIIDHARTLLDNPSAGASIADAAARRAHRDHIYEIRLNDIFSLLE